NYPARTGTTWPLYISKDGGYYSKYGLDVDLVFGVHPAGIAMIVSGEGAMTNYTLEQAMQAASKDGSLIAYASSFKKSLFALMKKFDFRTVLDNSIVDRLVKEGFFEKLFGPTIKAEQERKAKLAFR